MRVSGVECRLEGDVQVGDGGACEDQTSQSQIKAAARDIECGLCGKEVYKCLEEKKPASRSKIAIHTCRCAVVAA